jgi:hypothetical protein
MPQRMHQLSMLPRFENPEQVMQGVPGLGAVPEAERLPIVDMLLQLSKGVHEALAHAYGCQAYAVQLEPEARHWIEMLMRLHMGARSVGRSGPDLCNDYYRIPVDLRGALFAKFVDPVVATLSAMATDPEVCARGCPEVCARDRGFVFTFEGGPASAVATGARVLGPGSQPSSDPLPASANAAISRARLPSLSDFSGVCFRKDAVKGLREAASWVRKAEQSAALSGLHGADAVAWATAHFSGAASDWWLSYEGRVGCASFSSLLQAITARFVGADAFDLLAGNLMVQTLSSFPTYDAFKAWFSSTVAAMRVFASEGRMWGDNVLVDRLVVAMIGTRYHEGVVLDPDTNARPTSLDRALLLLDKHHNLLRGRRQEHGVERTILGEDPAAKRLKTKGVGSGRPGGGGGGSGGGYGGPGPGKGAGGGQGGSHGKGRQDKAGTPGQRQQPTGPARPDAFAGHKDAAQLRALVARIPAHCRPSDSEVLARWNAGRTGSDGRREQVCVVCGQAGHTISACPRMSAN